MGPQESDMKFRCHQFFAICSICIFCIAPLAFFSGCEVPEDPMIGLLETNSTDSRVNDLSRTMDFVFSERQFDMREFTDKVSIGLNRWGTYSDETLKDIPWEMDAAVQSLFDEHESLPILQRNAELSFINTDTNFLQETVWLSQIAKRVRENSQPRQLELLRLAAGDFKAEAKDDSPVETMVAKLHPDLDEKQARDLASAISLFDWVTRNIQLENAFDDSEGSADEFRLNDAESLPAAGVPGLGYTQYLWQTLVYARGDYVERAKLFLALCEQSGLEAVMFAVPGEDSDKLWAVGVVIGDDYYLFDSKLGLPIPGKKTGTVATLAQVRADASLLTSLDLSVEESIADETDYWVKSEETKNLKALMYFAPEAVSRRMKALETSLVGDQRLALTNLPSERIKSLPKTDGVKPSPWSISLDTHEFRQTVRESIPKANTDDKLRDRLAWHFVNEDYIDNFPIYRTARARFFKGKFETAADDNSRDSVQSFRFLMYTNELIDNLGANREMQVLHGIRKGDSLAEFQRRLLSVQERMRLVRRDAGLFLTQAQFDNDNVSTTSNWIPKLMDREETERWDGAMNYLYGRALESQHDYDRAIEFYKKDGPQVHGNLIRARNLKGLIETL